MHDGEQLTAVRNGKLARSRKQKSLTASESTGLKNCIALKWSTNKLNICKLWHWSFIVYTACFCGKTVNPSRKVFIVALSDDHNLNDFKSILTLPPTWKKSKTLRSFMTLLWPTMPRSVNSGAIKIGWKLDICGKGSFHCLFLGRSSRFEEWKKSIYSLLMTFTCTTKFSWKSLRQSQRRLKRFFCWATKLPLLMLFMSYLLQFCDSIASYRETWGVVSLGSDITKIRVLINCLAFENNF